MCPYKKMFYSTPIQKFQNIYCELPLSHSFVSPDGAAWEAVCLFRCLHFASNALSASEEWVWPLSF